MKDMSDFWGRHVILRNELHKGNPKSKRHIYAASEEELSIISLQELKMHPMTRDLKKKEQFRKWLSLEESTYTYHIM